MALTLSNSDGQLATTETTVLTNAGTTRIVVSLVFHNTDSVSRVVEVWAKKGGTARQIFHVDMAADDTLTYSEKLVLVSGDSIVGTAAANTAIDFWASYATVS